MPRLLPALILGLFAAHPAAVAVPPATPWGQNGHHIIARVAESRLSKPALDEIGRLLDGQSIVDIATWADQVRTTRPETGAWHYVDIPILDTSYDSVKWCANGNCVIAALDKFIAILGDKSRSKADRSEALKFVVHFVEDVHQPLHAGERGDKGGNDVKLTFLGKQSNLHSVWDSGLLQSLGRTDDEMVSDLEQQIAQRKDLAALASGTPRDWAMQSHDVSRDVVYHFLPQSLVLEQGYVDSSRAALNEQLVRASVRLTAVLERTLGH